MRFQWTRTPGEPTWARADERAMVEFAVEADSMDSAVRHAEAISGALGLLPHSLVLTRGESTTSGARIHFGGVLPIAASATPPSLSRPMLVCSNCGMHFRGQRGARCNVPSASTATAATVP